MTLTKAPRTLRDEIQRLLDESGVEEVSGYEVTDKEGNKSIVVSPDNPLMNRLAEDFVSIEPKQSAEAG